MATNKFEVYTGGIYLEHHYLTFVSLFVSFADVITQSVQFPSIPAPEKCPISFCFCQDMNRIDWQNLPELKS